jgi:hypothetical protein
MEKLRAGSSPSDLNDSSCLTAKRLQTKLTACRRVGLWPHQEPEQHLAGRFSSPCWNPSWVYTAITRAEHQVILVAI